MKNQTQPEPALTQREITPEFSKRSQKVITIDQHRKILAVINAAQFGSTAEFDLDLRYARGDGNPAKRNYWLSLTLKDGNRDDRDKLAGIAQDISSLIGRTVVVNPVSKVPASNGANEMRYNPK